MPQVVRLEVRRWGGRLPGALTTAAGSWSTRRGWLVRLWLQDGRSGLGEASPLPGFSPESTEAAGRALLALAARIAERPLPLPSLTGSGVPWSLARWLAAPLRRTPSAAFAVQSALLDALARGEEQPLHRWLRGTLAMPEEDPLPVTAWLGTLRHGEAPGPLGERLAELAASGARAAKLKLLPSLLEHPVSRRRQLEALARADASLRLRLDLQGRPGSRAHAERLVREAATLLPLEAIEEPLTFPRWRRHRPSAAWRATPVALDESLRRLLGHGGGTDLVGRWLRRGRARGLVLKPALLGGLAETASLARTAGRLGAPFTLTHLLDGPVAMAAVAELALALRPRWSVGLGPHPALGAFGRCPLPAALAAPHWLQPHEQPGLGLDLEAIWRLGGPP